MRTDDFRRGDIVFFAFDDPQYGKNIYIKRLIGMPGDKLEIRNGIVYINDTIGDKYWRYKYTYKVLGADKRSLIKKGVVRDDEVQVIGDMLYLSLDPEEACSLAKAGLPHFSLFLTPPGEKNEPIQNRYGQNWNTDHFGPYIIPGGHYFLMGDNRHNSADSRYLGPVREADIHGIIFH